MTAETAIVQNPGEAKETLDLFGGLIAIQADDADTRGAYSLLHMSAPKWPASSLLEGYTSRLRGGAHGGRLASVSIYGALWPWDASTLAVGMEYVKPPGERGPLVWL